MHDKKQDLQTLIATHSRRLQKLNEQRAFRGIATPPEVLIEIENIENELRGLVVDLSAFAAPQRTQQPDAPVIHLHNWGRPPAEPPDVAVYLNWQAPGRFKERPDRTRRVPAPAVWADDLLPALRALPQQMAAQEWVRLEGKAALSTGLAVGTIFRAKERYRLEVAQFVPDKGHTEYWASNAQPPAGVPDPRFGLLVAERPPDAPAPTATAEDMVVVVGALNTTAIAKVLEDVGRYFGEPAAFSAIAAGQSDGIRAVKAVLALEATAATQEGRPLEGWEAAGLARSSTALINNFKQRVKPARLHLFVAGPLSLAVFMGHFWIHIGCPVQGYEVVGTEPVYAPTCLIEGL
ncbi:MAG: hypothetical protein KDJ97_26315 [Anaerolineae bacterium]|nr:hypothetical protein [Anaerolineae bacterium]